ncbi:MAG: phenylalanine--tRNA ligase subunit beta [Firmicutes bacterium]|nr:phenylalanine--tRNA ligase subunit beta [Bacillota bacterium]
MNVSLNWLKELVDINCSYPELVQKFNLKSAEISRLEKLVDASLLTTGYVLTCVDHPSSDHLHVCEVDVKNETLQIICGAPNVAAGQKVVVALVGATLPGDFSIKKAKIRGIESFGMICSLDELGIEKKYHNEDGIHVLGDEAQIGEDPLKHLFLDDSVMEIDITPNRSDLLSMIGVAYDTKALLNTSVHLNKVDISEINEDNPSSVFTETKGCKSYYARVVKNVKIHESPRWLKSRLIAAGVRPINNVVDISNYVMLEYGQPLHTFDFDKIETKKIVVKDASEKDVLVTLDGKKRILSPEDLIITDGEKIVALAGVMGGIETEVSEETSTILIESATFDPIRVRKTSKRLDLRSEASIRFERGLDPSRSKEACNRAAQMLKELAGGEITKGISFFDTHPHTPKVVNLSLSKVTRTTGREYTLDEIKDVFTRLSFEYSVHDGDFKVTVPSRRQDISGVQDLIEEIVRIHGYEHIPTSFPVTPTSGVLTRIQRLRRTVRSYLTSLGLDETNTYSLTTEEKATIFDLTQIPAIKLFNPMSEEKAYLRHSLLPSILDVLQYNLARKLDQVRLFELGRSYQIGHESEILSGVLSGDYQSTLWQGKKDPIDFFVVKGLLSGLLYHLSIENVEINKPSISIPFLHPGICAQIQLAGNSIGYFGKLHPEVEMKLGLPDTYVFELDFEAVSNYIVPEIIMSPIPKVPSVSRDIALLIEEHIPSDEIVKVIQSTMKASLQSVKIFDLYQGEKIQKGMKSIALNLVFQDNEKTFSTDEIDQFIARIVNRLNTTLGAELRI